MKVKSPEEKLINRNKYCFGLGTVGRDMFYAFEANALLYFLTHILSLPMFTDRHLDVICTGFPDPSG